MKITHLNNKDVKCYMAFVEEPTNPQKMRDFCKRFNASLCREAVQLHERLLASSDVEQYNKVYGQPKNCIEAKQGTKDKEPKIFKVRINKGYRKFFHNIKTIDGEALLTKDWCGEFYKITHLCVIEVNKHNYNAV